MDFLAEYGMFLLKLVTVAIAVIAVLVLLVGGLFGRLRSGRIDSSSPGNLKIRHLNADYEGSAMRISAAVLPAKGLKALRKKQKALKVTRRDGQRSKIFVIDFHGDLRADAATALREEITAMLGVPEPPEEIVVRLESLGGTVHGYGLAAAQLKRIRDREIRLTVAVDKVAASGGYMMACVADRILAAPFAILGSIGVVASLPNFNRVLKNHDIDYEQFKAGEYKRTVTILGENTDKAREKFQREIDDVHGLFKEFVSANRPQVDLDQVATGEHWYGTRALERQLADELITSDDYLLKASQDADLYLIAWKTEKTWVERMTSETFARVIASTIGRIAGN
ncbi:MAG: protease SohB [Wenzhouxiangellaceae bacterium]|nr:protease SohB [Wenzhouxiangellaceae bacterium]